MLRGGIISREISIGRMDIAWCWLLGWFGQVLIFGEFVSWPWSYIPLLEVDFRVLLVYLLVCMYAKCHLLWSYLSLYANGMKEDDFPGRS